MTNIMIGERCSGKTTHLIERSAREQIYILTSTKERAGCIAKQAKEMGLNIPFPVTVWEYFRSDKFRGSSIRIDGLLIDDVDDVIKEIFCGIPIHAVTLTDHGNIKRLEKIEKKKKKLTCEGCAFRKPFDPRKFVNYCCVDCRRAYEPNSYPYRYFWDYYMKESE